MCTQMLLPLGLVLISTASISWRVDEGAYLGQIAAVGDDWRSKARKAWRTAERVAARLDPARPNPLVAAAQGVSHLLCTSVCAGSCG